MPKLTPKQWITLGLSGIVLIAFAFVFLRATDSDAALAMNIVPGSEHPFARPGERYVIENGRIRSTPLCAAPEIAPFTKPADGLVFENVAGRYLPSALFWAMSIFIGTPVNADNGELPPNFYRIVWSAEHRYMKFIPGFTEDPFCAQARDEALNRGELVCRIESVYVPTGSNGNEPLFGFSFTSYCDANCPIGATEPCKPVRAVDVLQPNLATRIRRHLGLIEMRRGGA